MTSLMMKALVQYSGNLTKSLLGHGDFGMGNE